MKGKRLEWLAGEAVRQFAHTVVEPKQFTLRPRPVARPAIPSSPTNPSFIETNTSRIEVDILKTEEKKSEEVPKEKIFSAAQLEMFEAIEARERSMSHAEEQHIKREAIMASSLRRDESRGSTSTLSEFASAFRMNSYRRQ